LLNRFYYLFEGGEIIKTFDDKYERKSDNDGNLKSYSVYEPMIKYIPWITDNYFWQLELRFIPKKILFKKRHFKSLPDINLSEGKVLIYIDMDGQIGGSTSDSIGNKKISFPENHPWDLKLIIDVTTKKGSIVSFDKSYRENLEILTFEDSRYLDALFVRINLNSPVVNKIIDGRDTWHYVMTVKDTKIIDKIVPKKNSASLKSTKMVPLTVKFDKDWQYKELELKTP